MLLCLLLSLSVQARQPVELSVQQQAVSLATALHYLKDPDGRLTLEQVRSLQWQNRFAPVVQERINFGYQDAVFWFRFSLRHQGAQPEEWWVDIAYPQHDSLKAWCYALDNEEWVEPDVIFSGGDQTGLPPDYRRGYQFAVPMQPGMTRECLIRVYSRNLMKMPIYLRSGDEAWKHDQRTQWAIGLFYGAIVGLVVLNILIGIYTRQSLYFTYGFHVLFTLSYFAALDGVFYQLLPSMSRLVNLSVHFSATLALIFGILFTKQYLRLFERNPLFDRISLLLAFAGAIFLLLSLEWPLKFSILGMVLYTVTGIAFILYTGIQEVLWQYQPAKLFVTAYLVQLISAILMSLTVLSSFEIYDASMLGFRVGFVLQVIIMTYALGNRLAYLNEQAREATTEKQLLAREASLQNLFLDVLAVRLQIVEKALSGTSDYLVDALRSSSIFPKLEPMVVDFQLSVQRIINGLHQAGSSTVHKSQGMSLDPETFSLKRWLQEVNKRIQGKCRQTRLGFYFDSGLFSHDKRFADAYRLSQFVEALMDYLSSSDACEAIGWEIYPDPLNQDVVRCYCYRIRDVESGEKAHEENLSPISAFTVAEQLLEAFGSHFQPVIQPDPGQPGKLREGYAFELDLPVYQGK